MFTQQTGKSCRFLLPVLFVLILSLGSAAQVINGSIAGDVKDPSGAYVAQATVTIKAPAIGVNTQVKTNENGTFVVPNLPPGTYEVTAAADGFNPLTKTGIILTTGDRLNAGEFVLAVGTTGETVQVSAEAAQMQLQSDSGERSDLITGKRHGEHQHRTDHDPGAPARQQRVAVGTEHAGRRRKDRDQRRLPPVDQIPEGERAPGVVEQRGDRDDRHHRLRPQHRHQHQRHQRAGTIAGDSPDHRRKHRHGGDQEQFEGRDRGQRGKKRVEHRFSWPDPKHGHPCLCCSSG